MRRPLSTLNPVFYFVIVRLRCFRRRMQWWLGRQKFAKTMYNTPLKYRMYKHQSVLIRKMGDSDIALQHNKVVNLQIALKKINGIMIYPGETFSFHYLVGAPTKRKGYLKGMVLSNGKAKSATGGGLCQIANLIHWLCLHSPLTVTERHHHSFDPFPDEGRVVPFGSGASLFYNYVDYQFTNNTGYTFQLLFWLDKKCINGDLRVDTELPYKYHVFEKEHSFLKEGEDFYRRNELWRNRYRKIDGEVIETEFLQKNNALVKYIPVEYVAAQASKT